MSKPRRSHEEPLSSFPHLTCGEFSRAINKLLQLNDQHGQNHDEWIAMDIVSQNETTYLSIAKSLPRDAASPPEEHEADGEVEEDDDEEVLSRPMRLQPAYHYDIVFSPTYRVPVLHVSISDTQQRYPPTMAILKAHVIPTQFQAEIEHVGIIGGITVTDHPATNRPVFFIHPCQTADVMKAVAGNRHLTADEYLVMWLGAFGKCVGLNVPLALARHIESTAQDVN